jgi:hypothetical protein
MISNTFQVIVAGGWKNKVDITPSFRLVGDSFHNGRNARVVFLILEDYANIEGQPAGSTEPLINEKRFWLMLVEIQLHNAPKPWRRPCSLSPSTTDLAEQ